MHWLETWIFFQSSLRDSFRERKREGKRERERERERDWERDGFFSQEFVFFVYVSLCYIKRFFFQEKQKWKEKQFWLFYL